MEKISGWFTQDVTEYRSSDKEGVGRLRWKGNKCYRWVRNSTGGALTAGKAYYHGTTNTSGYNWDEEIFTFGQSSKGTAINMLAGISVSAIPDGQFGWIQVYGLNSSIPVNGGTTDVAVGDSLKGVSGQTYLIQDAAAGTAPASGRRHVIALEAETAAGPTSHVGFIHCL